MYLQTKRLELKPFTVDSLDALTELLTDEMVKQTYMVPDFPDRQAALPLAQRLKALSEGERPLVLGIYRGEQLVGILNETDRTEEKIEVGYALLPRFHNQGYASEALRAVIAHLLDQGFRAVVAGAFVENEASIRVMIKSGMQKLAYTDETEYRGRVHPCVYYGAGATD